MSSTSTTQAAVNDGGAAATNPTSPKKAPLTIQDKAFNEEEEGVTTLDVGGIAVKLDKLGPMLINNDGVS
jgi:hypothetical protein